MRRRFFWSLLGAVAVTLLIVTLLGGALTLSAVRSQARAEMQRQLSQIVDLVQDGLVADGVELSGPLTRDVLNEAPTVRRIIMEAGRVAGPEAAVRLVIVTPGQRVLGGLPDAVADGFDYETVLGGGVMTERITDQAGGSAAEVVAQSVADVGRSESVLAVVLIRQSDVVKLGSVLRQMVFPLLVAAVVAAVVAGRMSRWLVRRLSRLRETARELAAGNPEARVPVEGSDEISELATAFNDMASDLEAARERERDFLVSVGHDLRTPLTTVSGYVEVLGEGNLEAGEIARIAGVLDRETGRLRRLVEDLMLLARLEAREFTIQPEKVDVVAHLGETIEALRRRAEEAHVQLRYEAEGSGVVTVDPDRLDQVASNLIENALRYTPEAGQVTVRLTLNPAGIRLEVGDTGPGIHAEDLPHIFEKFYVARKYRRVRPEGSGLGLSIVREITDAMGGSVEARSGADGTVVTVILPASDSPTM